MYVYIFGNNYQAGNDQLCLPIIFYASSQFSLIWDLFNILSDKLALLFCLNAIKITNINKLLLRRIIESTPSAIDETINGKSSEDTVF